MYEGGFIRDKQEGKCKFTLTDGSYFEGEIHGKKFEGYKKEKVKELQGIFMLVGDYNVDIEFIIERKGQGIVQTKDGRFFEGEFINE